MCLFVCVCMCTVHACMCVNVCMRYIMHDDYMMLYHHLQKLKSIKMCTLFKHLQQSLIILMLHPNNTITIIFLPLLILYYHRKYQKKFCQLLLHP